MKLIFPIKQYQKLRTYVNATEYEISGLGKVKKDGENFVIEEVRLFRQKATMGNTILDKRDLGKFYDELVRNGEDLRNWKLWFHSHCDMEAFWSSVDVKTIEDFDNEMAQDNWMISLVTNKSGKTLIRIDIFQPIRCTIDDIDFDIDFEDKELEEATLDEITEKVEIYVPFQTKNREKKRTDWLNKTPPGKNVFPPNTSYAYGTKGEILLPSDKNTIGDGKQGD